MSQYQSFKLDRIPAVVIVMPCCRACGTTGRFEASSTHEAISMARRMGWHRFNFPESCDPNSEPFYCQECSQIPDKQVRLHIGDAMKAINTAEEKIMRLVDGALDDIDEEDLKKVEKLLEAAGRAVVLMRSASMGPPPQMEKR